RERTHRGHGHLVGGRLSRDPLRCAPQRDDRALGRSAAVGEDRPPGSAAGRGRTDPPTGRARLAASGAAGHGPWLPGDPDGRRGHGHRGHAEPLPAVAVRLELLTTRWTLTALQTM